MNRQLKSILKDLQEIALSFLKAPFKFMKSSFRRDPKFLLLYGFIIQLFIGVVSILFASHGGLGIFSFISPMIAGVLVAYCQQIIICAVVWGLFKYFQKKKETTREWVSLFFLASLPYWAMCFLMTLVSLLMTSSGDLIFSFFFALNLILELSRFCGLYIVLGNKFPGERKNLKIWLIVALMIYIISAARLHDAYNLIQYD